MALTPDNVVCVYRANDAESEDIALRYQRLHGLSSEQLIPIDCSAIEILSDYATFQSEVETPLLQALVSGSASDYTVYAIVLMPKVPGGFYHEGDTISATSRLSRIYHTFSKKTLNPLYDRRLFKRFDGEDREVALICTRFDSPLSAITSDWFANIESHFNQITSSGTFYFDGYSAEMMTGSSQYQAELLFFHDSLLQRLGLNIQSTVQVDPYVDPIIGSVKDDSFFWGWGADRGSLSFFKSSNALRGFFYNADSDGAASMRDLDATTWPLLAIRRGYVASAGAMSDPTIYGYLRPYPFYDALFRGTTLGEALLFSVPHLDWTMAFFGDPLMTFGFPNKFDIVDLIEFDKAWREMADCTAQSIINIFKKVDTVQELWDFIIGINDIQVALDLYEPTEIYRRSYPENSWKNDYVNLVKSLFNLVTIRNQTNFKRFYPNLAAYLEETDSQIPEILVETIQNEQVTGEILESNLYTEGSWDFVFDLQHYTSGFAFYHFTLEISDVADFSNILFVENSQTSQENWFYENAENNFVQMSANGVTSNYAGNLVKYSSKNSENLQRGEFYYFRIRQKDQLATYDWRVFHQLIYK